MIKLLATLCGACEPKPWAKFYFQLRSVERPCDKCGVLAHCEGFDIEALEKAKILDLVPEIATKMRNLFKQLSEIK